MLPQSSRRAAKFKFTPKRPSGRDVVKAEGVCKAYGEHRVLNDAGLQVRRGDRLAVIGANGLGKSTLLKILVDELKADAGEVEWGHETHVGYFAQNHSDLLTDGESNLLQTIWAKVPTEGESTVRGRLGRMLFTADDVKKTVGVLSGGEAARLIFALLDASLPNVLVLDEPTNHLDLESIEALADALQSFDGTLIFVSHDRWFVSKLATRIIEVRSDGLLDFPGNYDDYLSSHGEDHLDRDVAELKAKKSKKEAKKGKRKKGGQPPEPERKPEAELSNEERRKQSNRKKALPGKRDELMRSIEGTEKRCAEIAEEFAKPDFYMTAPKSDVEKLQKEERRLRGKLEDLMQRWERIEAEMEQLGIR